MTTVNLSKFKKELLFLPLGGSGEIGMNCNLYHYNGKWIIIDMGIGFALNIPGVDLLIPDISFLKKYRKDILGLIVTHIHEDHLGAIQYLWEELRIPIYCSEFATEFLKEKLGECSFLDKIKFIRTEAGQKISLKPFSLEFIGLTHSAPEMNAVLIKTEKGNILHTGDWKFDNHPVIGASSDKARLQQLGDNREVLATVCDSTNIFSEKETRSESELLDSLINLMINKKGMVVVTIFASNISRIQTIYNAAKACNREVVLAGKSLFRITKVAKKVGYFKKDMKFLADKEIRDYQRNELLIISTGCQGELLAATNKMANDSHLTLRIKKGDTIIFASKMIPGNEKNILTLHNKFAEKDVEVITDKDAFVHVSGHYTQNDLKEMYQLVKPEMTIAVHGESSHLNEHKKIAQQFGIKNVIKAKNGNIIKLDRDNPKVIETIPIKFKVLDGKRILPADSEIIKTRRKIMEIGVVFIHLILNKKFKLIKSPIVSAPGAYDLEKDTVMYEIFKEDISHALRDSIKQLASIKSKNNKKFNTDKDKLKFIEQQIRRVVNSIFNQDIGKKPEIEISFTII